MIPEAVIVVLSYVRVTAMYHNLMSIAYPWAVAGTGVALHLSPAGWYFAAVSQFVYQFLLYISLWKWFLWAAFLFRLSRLDLQVVPTHPDRHGGLGFLGMSPLAIAPTAFVACAAIGATSLNTYQLPFIIYLPEYPATTISSPRNHCIRLRTDVSDSQNKILTLKGVGYKFITE